MTRKILYIRNFASKVDINTYNLQEIGFGKALVKKGYDCDIVYYTDESKSHEQTIYTYRKNRLSIIWMPALKFLSNGIYLKVLKKSFLDKYDYIITTEYNQIMTYLLSILCKDKLILYHGPYKDNSKKLVQKVYDTFFLKTIAKNIKYAFAKSKLAEEYLRNKGFKKVQTLGVGLDTSRFESGELVDVSNEIKEKLDNIRDKKVLLYVGKLEERRNIKFLFNVFYKLRKLNEDVILLVVGDGKQDDVEAYFMYAKQLGIEHDINHIKKVSQEHLKYIYEKADVFLLPTKYDPFGMVLLESMYFGVPVVSSVNGGAVTIIDNEINGFIIETFDEDLWVNKISLLLGNESLRAQFSNNGKKNIRENFIWDVIAEKLLEKIHQERIK
ncbi:glycosyl transferase, group 1 [Geobacillus proteiniphilus]|uniref:Glycosyl transferase, group 1 n=1 Tax=Geobacillus proteiniphilus TaxID=860353 RepID=A0A1Q5SWY9_9BACL|nr:glycosyltransferase family 4 protein [Geobacillus proteiniphilus]OKO92452.1 glycosyl transferase, group 1 [Geobacillus proteiniphilus]